MYIQIVLPRHIKYQPNRINIQSNTPENYFRISIFIPFLDIFISEIKCRFIDHKTTLSGFVVYSQKLLLPAVKTLINL